MTTLVLLTLAALTSCADPSDAGSDAQLTTRQQTMFWESEDYPFPTAQDQIVPPHLPGPLWACATVVVVTGVVEESPVSIFDADTDKVLGEGIAGMGSATVTLQSPLVVGQRIQAQQVVDGQLSPSSNIQTVVEYQGALPTPRLVEGIWECGRGVLVNGGLSGANMLLTRYDNQNTNTGLYGDKRVDSDSVMIRINNNISSTHVTHELAAQQFLCTESDVSNRKPIVAAPNPMPIPQINSAFVGSRIVGAQNTVSAGASFTLLNNGSSIGNYVTVANQSEYQLSFPLAANATLTATQALCTTSATSISFTPAPASQLLTLIGTPSLLEPICPGARYVKARANVGEGYLVLDNDTVSTNGYISLVSASSGETVIGIPSGTNLTSGQQLRVRQILPTASSPYSAPVTVGTGERFSVEGAVTLTDQDTGLPVSGFVSETSRGPRFIFHECCDANAATSFTGQVLDAKNEVYATVTFYQQFSGNYEAQWDWFVPSSDPAKLTPPPAGDYTLNIQKPCSNTLGSLAFKVFRGTVDTSDASVPNEVTLSISGSETSVSTTSGNALVSIPAGQPRTLTASATDFNGIRSVLIMPDPLALLPGVRGKLAAPQAPVPTTLTHTMTLPAMLPTQQVNLTVRGTNFRSGSPNRIDTGTLTITATQATPLIEEISPEATYTNDGEGVMVTLKIGGDHLFYSNLTTVVTFEAADGTLHTAPSFNTGSSEESTLRDVLLPTSLIGKGGATQVRVAVGAITSAPFTMQLLDRPDGFNTIEQGQLLKPTFGEPIIHECKDANNVAVTSATHPNAVKFVEISPNIMGSQYTHTARFKLVDGSYADEEIPFSMNSHTSGPVGGVGITTDCRLVTVLSFQGSGTPASIRYRTNFVYFRADGMTHPYSYGGSAPGYIFQETSGDEIGFVTHPHLWRLMVAKDGSAAVLTHGRPTPTNNNNNFGMTATVIDFATLAASSNRREVEGTCSNVNSCVFTADLTQGRKVEVFLDKGNGPVSFINPPEILGD